MTGSIQQQIRFIDAMVEQLLDQRLHLMGDLKEGRRSLIDYPAISRRRASAKDDRKRRATFDDVLKMGRDAGVFE